MVLWWIGNAVILLVVVPVVLLLSRRILVTAHEILRYAGDIDERSAALAANLAPVPSLAGTRDQAGEVRTQSVAYADALRRLGRLG